MMGRFGTVLRMIRFEHSVFALPFALAGAWQAAAGVPPWRDLALVVVAAVAARSAAMAFNRLVDRELDARNPRTAGRELVTGAISPAWTAGFVLACAALFVLAAFALAPLCGWLSLPVLVVLLGYSWLKRFTFLCHLGLGLALGCAPAGAWLAVHKTLDGNWLEPILVGGGVVCWVAGFDLLYALQDLEHDRREGIHSFPARFGLTATLRAARLAHLVGLGLWLLAGRQGGRGVLYLAGVAGVAALLLVEHLLLRGGRRERVPVAFFQVNAWVGPLFFAGLWADLALQGSAATLAT